MIGRKAIVTVSGIWIFLTIKCFEIILNVLSLFSKGISDKWCWFETYYYKEWRFYRSNGGNIISKKYNSICFTLENPKFFLKRPSKENWITHNLNALVFCSFVSFVSSVTPNVCFWQISLIGSVLFQALQKNQYLQS